MKGIYIDTELVLLMYNAHSHFSLKNLGKKVCIIYSKLQYMHIIHRESFSILFLA